MILILIFSPLSRVLVSDRSSFAAFRPPFGVSCGLVDPPVAPKLSNTNRLCFSKLTCMHSSQFRQQHNTFGGGGAGKGPDQPTPQVWTAFAHYHRCGPEAPAPSSSPSAQSWGQLPRAPSWRGRRCRSGRNSGRLAQEGRPERRGDWKWIPWLFSGHKF